MKNILFSSKKRGVFYLMSLCVILLLLSGNLISADDSYIYVYVKNNSTYAPISGALVGCAGPGDENCEGYTNGSGYVKLEVEGGGWYTVNAIAAGYVSNQANVYVPDNRSASVTIYLTPQ